MTRLLIGTAIIAFTLSTASYAQERKMPDKKPLTEYVTKKDGTEPAFRNEYWDNHEEGIYVDINSGEPLFSSKDKYDSGTGWPSFTKPINPQEIEEVEDNSFFTRRTEVRAKTLTHI